MSSLPDYHPLPHYPKIPLASLFTAASTHSVALLESCWQFDPILRPSCQDLLASDYFKTGGCTLPHHLPRLLDETPDASLSSLPIKEESVKKEVKSGVKRAAHDVDPLHSKRNAIHGRLTHD